MSEDQGREEEPESHLHFMRKVNGVWECQEDGCSERRDKNGRPVNPVHLKVVE